MNEKQKFILGGLALGCAALWIGAYILQFADDTWWEFPTFVTIFVTVIGGYAMALYGLVEL